MCINTPEPVRLVIWDLDETFWAGTLSEGGITWSEANAQIVRTLSTRGIINAICSKNSPEPVEAVLAEHDIAEHFVFPSISWSPKGPRLAALIEAVQLRPQTVLFIDDNPMNRAEAEHFVPGLQVADESIIPTLLDDPRLRGKADPQMNRLAQYRLLERRQKDMHLVGADTAAFLRSSRIVVSIDYNLAPHIDRAIELINRTNQLNFTKRRLPEDIDAARAELTSLLTDHTVQAALVHVRDAYGDYGYCGIYVTRRTRQFPRPRLLHFAFSCRILGMGIETWLYRQLGRPVLRVQGTVLTDPEGDTREIDWVHTAAPDATSATSSVVTPRIGTMLARGGCDMRALAHYFHMVSERVVEEFADLHGGMTPLSSGSLLAVHAISGAPQSLIRDSAILGFTPAHFRSAIAATQPATLWLLNFTLEIGIPLLRHRETGFLMPAWIPGYRGDTHAMLAADADDTGLGTELADRLRACFDDADDQPDAVFRDALHRILAHAPPTTRVVILLANELRPSPRGLVPIPPMAHRNALIAEIARDFPNAVLLSPAEIMSTDELAALERPHHYNRLVYFRIFERVMSLLSEQPA